MRSPSICVLTSGGPDSAILLQEGLKKHQVHPLYIASGCHWEMVEQFWLTKLLDFFSSPALSPLTILHSDLTPIFSQHWSYSGQNIPASSDEHLYIPGRNMHLLSQAALFCKARGIEEIWIGILIENRWADGQPPFLRLFEQACSKGLEIPIKIQTPFAQLNKGELIAKNSDFPYHLTFSCIDPQGNDHCGNCNKCSERKEYFEKVGIKCRGG